MKIHRQFPFLILRLDNLSSDSQILNSSEVFIEINSCRKKSQTTSKNTFPPVSIGEDAQNEITVAEIEMMDDNTIAKNESLDNDAIDNIIVAPVDSKTNVDRHTVLDFRYNSNVCLLYTSPSPRDRTRSRMPSSA